MSPTNNNDVLNGCYGSVYDPGGPSANYPDNVYSEITIAPFGATGILVDFASFKLESRDTLFMYEGAGTTGTLIGKYTGLSIPNGGTITVNTGAVTVVLESNNWANNTGFELDWSCQYGNIPPVADFIASPTITCTGEVDFTDLSTGNPSSWTWDFGDGNTAVIPNPTHTYTANGLYTVKMVASNVNGADSLTRSAYILVNRPNGPVATGAQSCAPAQLDLNASGPGPFLWYDSPTSANVIGSGSTFTTPWLNTTTTYYVASNAPPANQYVGPTDNSIGNSQYVFSSTIDYLTFDTYQEVTLLSVWIDAQTTGNKLIFLQDNQGNIISWTGGVVSTTGPQRLAVNLVIPAGTGWRLGGRFMDCASNTSGFSFPYTIPGKLSITGSSNPGFYYFYYDWEIQGEPCSSLRTPVLAEIGTGGGFTPVVTPSGTIDLCAGQSVALTAGSGTSWNWNNGDTTQSTTISTAGAYVVTVADTGGCPGISDTVFVNVNALPIATISPASALVCPGDSATLTATGGTSYVWSHGPTGSTVEVPAGNYSVTATDGAGCSAVSNSVTVTQANPSATISGATEICAGGSEILTANTGTAWLWSTGATTQSIIITAPGTYTVDVTDVNNCTATSAPHVVTVGAGPTAGISPLGPLDICQGNTVTLTASGGATYLWSTGATSSSIDVGAAGNYFVIAFNTGGCRDTSAMVEVREHVPTAAISVLGNTALCPGETTTLMANSGTNYLWSTGATTASVQVNAAGTFTVSLTDSNGCAATSSPVTITQLAAPTATISPLGPWEVCPGNSISVTAGGGTSYTWSDAQVGASNSISTPGPYYVIATDGNGCTDTSDVYQLTQLTPVATVSGDTLVCPGDSVVLGANTGTNYAWSTGGNTQTVTVPAGSYTVALNDSNGCAATSAPFVVSNAAVPTASITGDTAFCPGNNANLTASGGDSYQWSTGSIGATLSVNTPGSYFVVAANSFGCVDTSANWDVQEFNPVATIAIQGATTLCQGDSVELVASTGTNYLWSTGETTASIWVSAAGSYTVTLTDSNGCSATSAPANISIAPFITAGISPAGNSLVCPVDSLLLTASGGTSYVWSTGATGPNLYVSAQGSYSVEAISAIGCKDTSASITLDIYQPVANITGGTTACLGDSIPLTASTGSNFTWSNGASTQQILAPPGSYSVSLLDSNGCAAISAVHVVSAAAAPTAGIAPAGVVNICPGGSTVLTANGGVGYEWSTGATSTSITVSTPGAYEVVAIGGNGCRDTSSSVTIAQFTPLATVSPAGPVQVCPGDSVQLTASVGSNFLWSNGETSNSIQASIPGNYTVSLLDANGCAATSSPVTVSQFTAPVATISPAGPWEVCPGDSISLTGSGGNTYEWSNAQTGNAIFASLPGTYHVITTDLNGCRDTSEVYALSSYTPVATISGPTMVCPGDSVLLTANTGSNYNWSHGATTQSVLVPAGTYTVTLSDSNGCLATSAGFTVSPSAVPTASISGDTSFCPGNVASLIASGGNTYTWSTGATGNTLAVTTAGVYSVVVENTLGCKDTSATFAVTELAPFAEVTVLGDTLLCNGDSVTLAASSGTNYLWSTGATSPTIWVNSVGSYTVSLVDSQGCAATSIPVNIGISANIIADITPPGASTLCPGDSLLLTASGGTIFNWSTGANTQSIYVDAPGNYFVEVSTASGCLDTSSTVNISLFTPVATITGDTLVCPSDSIALTASSGSNFLWSNGANTQQTFVPPGSYTVTLADSNGCTATSAVHVVSGTAGPTAGIAPATNVSTCPGEAVVFTASGGLGYLWSTGSTSDSILVTAPGDYSVIAIGVNGCSDSSAVVTLSNHVPTANITINGSPSLCPGDSVLLTASTGTNYLWSTGATTASIWANAAGSYSVTLLDSNGCSASSAPVVISIFAAPVAGISPVGDWQVCPGDSIALTATGGVSYVWSDAGTGSTNFISNPGNYYMVTTDANGCQDTSATYALAHFTPTATIAGDTQACLGDSVILTANSGSNYLWSSGATSQTVTVPIGSYTVTLDDSNGCFATSVPKLVQSAPQPTAGITGDTSFCTGGSAVLTASGGDSYLWSNGSTNPSITVTTPGIYTVVAENSFGCKDTTVGFLVLEWTPTAAVTVQGDTLLCSGDSVQLTASTGSNFLWSTGATTPSIWVNSVGSYSVSLSDSNSCPATAEPVNIAISANIIADINPAGPLDICPGDSILLTASGGATYEWSTGATTASIFATTPGSYSVIAATGSGCVDTSDVVTIGVFTPVATISGGTLACPGDSVVLTAGTGGSFSWSQGATTQQVLVPAGTYTVTLVDSNGCSATSTGHVVAAAPAPTATITPNTPTNICPGGSVVFTAGGGTSYSWSTSATGSSITASQTGNYFVIATDGNGCTDTSAIVPVSVHTPVASITVGGSTSLCAGDSVILTASTGSNYSWSNGETTASIYAKNAGSYSVSLLDSNGCFATSAPVVITVGSGIVAAIAPAGNPQICAGDSLLLTASGGSTYTWSTGATGTTTFIDTPGPYFVVAASASGCIDTSDVVTLSFYTPVASISGSNQVCVGDSTTLTANPGTAYVWNTGATTASIQASAGTYSVTVTDGNGCEALSGGFVVGNFPAPPVAGISPNGGDVCPGDSLLLTGSGGLTYVWSNGQTGSSLLAEAGTYSVVVSDGNGCRDTSGTVTVNSLTPVASISGEAGLCVGDSAQLVASAGTNVVWSTGDTGVDTIYVLTPGLVTVSLDDPNGCAAVSAPFSVTSNVAANAGIIPTDTVNLCAGDSLLLTGSGGTDFDWSTGASSASIWANSPGNYFVTVAGSGLCPDRSDTVTLIQTNPVAQISGDSGICAGNASTLMANAGSAYLWSTGSTTDMISAGPGDYLVSVTDSNGCVAVSDTFHVYAGGSVLPVSIFPDTGMLDCSLDSLILSVQQSGVIDTAVSRGADDAWEDSSEDMKRGSAWIKLANEGWAGLRFRGLDIPGNATITAAYLELTSRNDRSGANATVNLYAEDRANPNQFSNSDGNITDRPTTSNSVAWNMSAWEEDTVYQSPDISPLIQELLTSYGSFSAGRMVFLLEATGTSTRHAYSENHSGNDNEPRLHVEWSVPASQLTFQWSTGGTLDSNQVTVGTHWVETYDLNGCPTGTDTVTVTQRTTTIQLSADTLNVCPGDSAKLWVQAGAFPAATYLWNSGATTDTIMVENAGNYTVVGTSALGCTRTSDPATLVLTPNFPLGIEVDTIACIGEVLSFEPILPEGWALNFDASNDRVSVPDAPELNPTAAVTVEAWMRAESWKALYNQGTIVSKEQFGGPSGSEGFEIRVGQGGIASFRMGAAGTSLWYEAISPAIMSLNTWHHVAGTYDGTWVRIYVDGVIQDSVAHIGTISPSNQPLQFGRHPQFGFQNHDGDIDEVRLWNTAQTEAQIQANMNSELTGNEPGLVGYWPIEAGTGSITATDLSTNGNDGTLILMDPATDWIQPGAIGIAGTLAFDWNFGNFTTSTLQSPTNAYGAGATYPVTLIATEPNGCYAEANVNITVGASAAITVNLGVDTFVCFLDSIQLDAGNPGNSYLWSTGETTQTVTVPNGTGYWAQVEDSTGCTASDTILVGSLPHPVPLLGNDTTICDYDTLLLDAGYPGSTYLWSTGATTQTIEVDTGGTYWVEVINTDGCPGGDTITISEATVTAATSPTGLINLCAGSYLDITASGGVSYLWWDATSGAVNDSLSQSGSFYVIATDAFGCQDSAFFGINLLTPSTSVALSGDTVLCPGDSLELTSSFGQSYTWSNGATTRSITTDTAGAFSVTVTDPDGCVVSSDVIAVTADTPPVTTITPGDTTEICLGGNQTLSAIGGVNFLWSTGQTTPSLTVTQAGSYSVVGENVNGCKDTSDVAVIETFSTSASVINLGDSVLCPGDSTDLTVGLGSNYVWSNGATTPTVRVGDPIDYWVSYQDTNGCMIQSDTLSLLDAPFVEISVIGVQDICPGDSIVLQASGAATYQWSNGATTDSIFVDTSGTFYVIGYANTGCSDTSAVEALQFKVPEASVSIVGDTALCPHETVMLIASAGTGHVWNNGAMGDTIVVDSAFNYAVTLVDTQGCTATSAPVEIVYASLLPIAFTPPTPWRACPGDSLTITATNGDTYVWNTGDTVPTITVSTPGYYEVMVESSTGCRDTAGANFLFYTPTATISGPSGICPGDTVTLTANTGSNFNWSTGGTAPTLEVTTAGIYGLSMTDSNGCAATATPYDLEPFSPAEPEIEVVGLAGFCPGDSVKLKASGADTYEWSTGSTLDSLWANMAASFTLIGYTDDGCTDTSAATVITAFVPYAEIIGGTQLCSGDTLYLTANSGSGYLWNTGATSQSIEVTAAGGYTVSLVDSNGCSAGPDSVTVNLDTPPSAGILPGGPTTFCLGDSVTLTATGGSVVNWSNGATTQTITVDTTGTFSVIVVGGSGGCRDTSNSLATVLQIPDASITTSGSTTLCPGDSLVLTANAGAGYLWSTGQMTQSITVYVDGVYSVAVTDGNGCTAQAAITLVPGMMPAINIIPVGTTTVCPGQPVAFTASGGSNYLWSSGATTSSIGPVNAGDYFAIVTNQDGCTDTSATVTLANFTPVATVSPAGSHAICAGDSITLTANAGSNYLWSNGATNPSITVGTPGLYTVGLLDSNGCAATSAPVNVTLQTPPTATISPQQNVGICPGDSVELTAGGGVNYLWSTGETTNSIWINQVDTITVIATNANGCTDTSAAVTTTLLSPVANIVASGPLDFCPGESVTLTASTGTNFLWSTGDMTQSIVVTNPAAISLTLDDVNGCTATAGPVNISHFTPPVAGISPSGTLDICPGTAQTFTGSGGVSYIWTTGATGNTISASSPGGYAVIAIDGNGCRDTSAVATLGLLTPVATITPQGPTTFCRGDSVVLQASAGSNYLWSNGATTQSIAVKDPGAYSVDLLDPNGCAATAAPVIITLRQDPTASVFPGGNRDICPGDSLILTASGGNSYLWSTGATTDSISVSVAGLVYAIAADGFGCTDTSSIVNVGVFTPTASIISAGPLTICPGDSVNLTASAGSAFLWSTGETTPGIQAQNPGSYSVTITDLNGCEAVAAPVLVQHHTPPVANLSPNGADSVCMGDSLLLTASGGVSYQWTHGPTGSTVFVANPGNYAVVVTDGNGCRDTSASLDLAYYIPVATITAAGPTDICPGDSVTLSASAGSNYLWSNGATTASITVTSPGSYTVTLTDPNGCSATSASISVTHLTPPTAGISLSGPTAFCPGDSMVLLGTGGTSYEWSTGSTADSLWASNPGAYFVIATDGNGCTDTSQAINLTHLVPQASILANGPTSFCPGDSVVLTASTGANYLWSTGAITQSIVVANAGSYSVTLNDPNGCEATAAPVAISHFAVPTAGISPNGPLSICPGSAQTLTGSGGVTYLWNTGATSANISASTAGNYEVIAIDGNGCRDTSASVNVSLLTPVASITAGGPTTFCAGDSVILTASAGTNILWSTGETSPSIVARDPGAYSVSLTDPNGCQATAAPVIITLLSAPTAGISPLGNRNICPGDSIIFTASGGASYLWSTGETTSNITVSSAGSYYVIAANGSGCTDTSTTVSVGVFVPIASITPVGPVTICPADSIPLTASAGSNFLWSTGATTPTIQANGAGSYSVTLTDINGCEATAAPVTVTEFIPPVAGINPVGPVDICQGDSLLLTATGGVSYLWSQGSTNDSVFVNTAGAYDVVVTDANGCRDTSNTVNLGYHTPVASISASGPTTFCPGDSVTLTASAGSNFLWSTGATTQTITVSQVGAYAVDLDDPNGCRARAAPVSLTHFGLPTIVVSPSDTGTVCPGDSLLLTASGGSSYVWSTGVIGGTLFAPGANSYFVIGTDANGCSDTSSTVNIGTNVPVATITPAGPTTFCAGDSVTLTASAGTNFLWSNGATTQSVVIQQAGPVSVSLTDLNGCQATSTPLTLTHFTSPLATISPSGHTDICPGTFQVFTGSGGVNYTWNTGSNGATIAVSNPGTYQVIAIDANGCRDTSATVSLGNFIPVATITPLGATTFCRGDSVTLMASTGSNYLWSTGETTQTITVKDPGAYSLSLLDGNGCFASATPMIVTVRQDPIVGITPGTDRDVCPGDSLLLSGSGGTSYLWSNGASGPNLTVSNTGSYYVIVTDGFGCTDTSATVNIGNFVTQASITPGGPISICAGDSALMTASAGSDFLWSNGAVSPGLQVKTAGSYTVELTDLNGCRATSAPVVVNTYTPPVAMLNPVGGVAICPGDSLLLSASGGLTYEWLHGPTQANVFVSSVGNYAVVATDGNGCRDTSAAVTLTHHTPVATISPVGSTSICAGDSVELVASTGSDFLWVTGDTTASIFASGPGTYTVSLTDSNGCFATASPVTVTQFASPLVQINPMGSDSICPGDSLLLTASGANTYTWSTGDIGPSLSVSTVGNYSVVGIDVNGCRDTSGTFTLEHHVPTAQIVPNGPLTFCPGDSVTLSTNAGFGHLWSNGATTPTVTVLDSGLISVTLIDSNGCQATSAPLPVAHFARPVAGISASGPTNFCPGDSVTLTGTGGVNYQWSNGATTPQITLSSGTDVTVIATDINGCADTSGTTSIAVLQPTAAILGADSVVICPGDSVTLTASAGSGYLWSDGSTSASIVTASTGPYWVSMTDPGGCVSTSDMVEVVAGTVPAIVIAPAGLIEICPGTSLTLSASGAVNYRWNTGAFTADLIVGNAGNFSVIGTSADGCEDTSAVVQVRLSTPVADIVPAGPITICAGDSVTLTAGNGSGYLWSTGDTTQSILVSGAGSYSVALVDSNGCQASANPVNVLETMVPQAAILPADTFFLCPNDSVTLTTGSGSGYLWSTGDTTQTIVVGSPGRYAVAYDHPAGCRTPESDSTTVIVPATTPAVITPTGAQTICPGDSIILYASGGLGYTWSTGATSDSIIVTDPGNYFFVSTSAYGCTDTSAITPVIVDSVFASITAPFGVTVCAGDSAQLLAEPAGMTYVWSTGETSRSIWVGDAGLYNVTVTNASGCSANSGNIVLKVNQPPLPDFTWTTNGLVVEFVDLTQPTPWFWDWNFGDGDTSNWQNPAHTYDTSGSYVVTLVVTSQGCSDTLQDTVTVIGTGIDQLEGPGVLEVLGIYPNPFSSDLHIRLSIPEADELRVDLVSLMGQEMIEVFRKERVGGIVELDWQVPAGMTDGVYMLVIRSGDEVIKRKLIHLKE